MPLSAQDTLVRQHAIGASEVSCLLGLHPSKSIIDVFNRLVEGLEPEVSPEEARWMKEGEILEPAILAWWAHQKGIWKLDIEQPGTQVSTKWPRLCATPDGVVPKLGRLVEAKRSRFPSEEWGEDGTAEIPQHHIVQVQCTMAITGYEVCDVAALLGGGFHLYTVKADPTVQRAYHEVVTDFWNNHIKTGKEPPPDGHVHYTEDLKRRFPQALSDIVFVATAENEAAMQQYDEARSMVKHWEGIKEHAWQEISNAIGAAAGLMGHWGKATWSNVKGSLVTDWKSIALELGAPEALVQKHTLAKAGHRMLRVTKSKASRSRKEESPTDAAAASSVD